MRSTFGGLEVAKRALFAMQTTQQTTAHNIANANTKGYTRQVVNLVASRPIEAPGLMRSNIPGQLGQGVHFDSINRIREKFLDDQFYNESKSYGEWHIRSDTLDKLEAIMNEPSDTGIRQTIENFWNAWQELSMAPDNVTSRILVKERSLALADAFNHTSRKLSELSSDLTNSIEVKARQVDANLQHIANLNNEIFRLEGLGNNANDLRDQRDLIIDELSQVINVEVSETDAGYVVMMGVAELVNGINKNVVVDAAYIESQFGADLSSGEIYGLIHSRDQYITSYQAGLNEMARAIAEGEVEITLPAGTVLPDGVSVVGIDGNTYTDTLNDAVTVIVQGINGIHQLGHTMEGTGGEPFFELTAGDEAASLGVNQNIADNVALIAASNRTYTDENGDLRAVPGNNEIALLIAGMKNYKVTFPGTSEQGTIDDYFSSMIGRLGVEGQEANRHEVNQRILVDQVDAKRQSVSGVSLDEEMANMIMYQHTYNAAARILTTFDEMLNRVINNMGLVGR